MTRAFAFHNNRVVNGERVRQARESALLTQLELARLVNVSQSMIGHIENGLKQPSADLVESIASSSGVTTDFLYLPTGPRLPEGSMLFRARADISAKKYLQTRAIADEILEIHLKLAQRFELPQAKIVPIEGDPVRAARETRRLLGLEELKPIAHLMRAFEKAGGIILALPELQGRDGFAMWSQSHPIVGLAATPSGDRLRFSLAHEIGHLVLHHAPTAKQSAEKEAHRFAAELLMPEEAIASDFESIVTLDRLGRLKQRWGVSMSALLLRGRDLGLVARRSFDKLMVQLGPYRMQEPSMYGVPTERPRVLRQMAETIYGEKLDYHLIASDYGLKADFVESLLGRYASAHDIAESSRSRKVVSISVRPKQRIMAKSDSLVGLQQG